MQEDWNYMKCSLIPRFSRLRSGRAWEWGYMKCTYHDQVSSTSHHLCWYPNQMPTKLWFHLQKWELMHQHQHCLDLATFHLNFHWLHNDKTESQKQHYIPPSQMIDPTDVKAKIDVDFQGGSSLLVRHLSHVILHIMPNFQFTQVEPQHSILCQPYIK